MTRYRATLAYDGSAYNGFQVQPDVPTIQGEVEAALETILKVPTTLYGAGRTDTGVHATGQVVAFDADWKHDDETLLKALNARLPEDIALQDIMQQEGFHPRFDALSRTYRYQVAAVDVRQPLLSKRAWQMQKRLDDAALQHIADMLLGEHDFAAFGNPPTGINTVRRVFQSRWQSDNTAYGRLYVYTVEATAFLHHMVRRLVAIQVAVATGLISPDTFEDVFRSADLTRNRWIAPPQGLTLAKVSYPPSTNTVLDYQSEN